jgi:hypothetical protein
MWFNYLTKPPKYRSFIHLFYSGSGLGATSFLQSKWIITLCVQSQLCLLFISMRNRIRIQRAKPMRIRILVRLSMLLDLDPHSQYGSGSSQPNICLSMRIRIHNTGNKDWTTEFGVHKSNQIIKELTTWSNFCITVKNFGKPITNWTLNGLAQTY